MPHPRPHLAELAERHLAQERDARRATRRDFVRTLLQIAVATAVGLLLMGLAIWVGDEGSGRIYWWSGMILWIAGDALALIGFYQRGVRRGDW